jgi:hypothetical protein
LISRLEKSRWEIAMNKLALCVAISAALVMGSTPALAQGNASVAVSAGKMLYDSSGKRVALINRVTSEGNAQVILDGKLVNVPASTLSEANGKITTSMSKADLGRRG